MSKAFTAAEAKIIDFLTRQVRNAVLAERPHARVEIERADTETGEVVFKVSETIEFIEITFTQEACDEHP